MAAAAGAAGWLACSCPRAAHHARAPLMEIARRLLVPAAIHAISAGLYLMSRGQGGGYGLRNLLEEQTPPPDGSGSTKLDFSDVQVIRQMSEESAKLSDKVLPCVVSINTLSLERTQTLAIDPLRGFAGDKLPRDQRGEEAERGHA